MRLFLCALLACSLNAFAQSKPDLPARINSIREQLPTCDQSIKSLRDRGEDVSYPLVTYTVLDNFTNYALEDLTKSIPQGWGFLPVNGCDASYAAVKDAHGGTWAAKIINRTPQKPNVYAMLENSNGVKLKAGQAYTLSAWAKGDGTVSFTLNPSWSSRLDIEKPGPEWKRFSKTFTPTDAEVGFGPRVISQDVATGITLDDIALVEGDQPEAGPNLMPNGSFEESWFAHRVEREIGDMEAMTARLKQQLADATAGKIKLPHVPRWDGKQRPTISGPSFLDANGRPIFFVGYGHFKQVRTDIEKFPAYGINIVQHGEFGPSSVFPTEEKTENAAIDQLIGELDRASKAGVAVDFLISPHYVPDWLFTKYPHLRKARADFFPYSIYAPEGRALVQRFVDYVVPKIKDKPALLSICLTNEPINKQEPDEFSIRAWREWLQKRHGDIATLNARWKSTYVKFEEIPQPNPLGQSGENRPGPAWADFCRWNGEYFAEFHKVFADYVKAVAPEIPVHAKATTWHIYRSENASHGDDATLLNNVTNISGNDSVNLWSFKERWGDLIERGTFDFAQGWRENAIGYELQRSAHDAPVFNSENHLIFDRDDRYVDPAHIRAALWMGAIHGQSATTIWVWERELENPRSDFSGSIMERASCSEAVGIVNHDLNRAAREITAIQKAPPRVLILQNNTSTVWEGHRYDDCFTKLFTALSFHGLKIGFLTERQLEQGRLSDAPVLFIPDSVHISAAAQKSLQNCKGKIIPVGTGPLLIKDEYDASIQEMIPMEKPIAFKTDRTGWHTLWEELCVRLPPLKLGPGIKLYNVDREPQFDVQYQVGKLDGALIINLYNASHDPQTVMFRRTVYDVLTGQARAPEEVIKLAPMEVRLFRCEAP